MNWQRKPIHRHRRTRNPIAGLGAAAALWLSIAAPLPPGVAAEPRSDAELDIRQRRLLQRVLRHALAEARPFIVRIETIGGAAPDADQPSERPAGRLATADGPTTGVIWTPDGHILTSSFHFMREPQVITVALADGRRLVGDLIARDRPARLALLKIDADNLPTPERVSPDAVKIGQWAMAAGFGHAAHDPAVTLGVISALNRMDGLALQTDAKTSPANYGGPLLDMRGRLLGICVPAAGIVSDELAGVEWYNSGVGFAIHNAFIEHRFPRYKQGADLKGGLLGLLLDTRPNVVGQTGQSEPLGLTVANVLVRSTPDDMPLIAGDTITHIDDQPTPTLVALHRAVARHAAGDTITIRYLRDGEIAGAEVRLLDKQEALELQPASDN